MSSTFSVAMCTYNGAAFVAEQLESVAGQTRPPDELVVCDDRSTDATRDIVEGFAARAPFPVRLFVNEENLGSTRNFGRAVALCAGQLVALCDQDDAWLPEKLERLEARFAARPSVGFVFTDAELADERLRPTGRRLWESIGFGEREQRLVRRGRALDLLLAGSHVTGATMAFRARFKEIILDIPADLPVIHDGWIALVLAAASDADFIAEPLVRYRQHPGQQIGATKPARPDTPPGLEGFAHVARRANPYRDLIRIAERARERLAGWESGGEAAAEGVRRLDAHLRHLRARERLPGSLPRRLPVVLRELLTLRYHRYSNGALSAVKDLLAGGA
jgi:glycosyltransferase involved in cell wall biosynthesis